jgi:threonyl-tRNA synthetase
MKYTHCVEFEAMGLDNLGSFQYIPLHILCLDEEEAETIATVLKRDKLQYTDVHISELDESIEEEEV